MAPVDKKTVHVSNSSTIGKEPINDSKSRNVTIERRSNLKEFSETCGSYFSSCSPRTIPTLAGPPLISTPVASSKGFSARSRILPGKDVPSVGGLDDSSDSAESSVEESYYLTPPENRSVHESSPNKYSSENSGNLSMVQRNVHLTATERRQRKLRIREERHCKLDFHEHRRSSYWYLPGTKSARVEPFYLKGFCDPHLALPVTKARKKLVHFDFDIHAGRKPNFTATPANPIVSRTWSSICLENEIPRDTKRIALDYKSLNRRRTWPAELEEAHVISSIRTRLTCRPVCPAQFETPATITLRQAKERLGNKMPGSAQIAAKLSSNMSAATTNMQSAPKASSLIAYLVMTKDIEYVADLIQASFGQRGSQIHQNDFFSTPELYMDPRARPKTTRKPSFVNIGCIPTQPNVAADVAMTFTNILADSSSASTPRPKDLSTDPPQSSNIVSRVLSRGSLHEIVWNDKGMPESLSSYSRTSLSSSTSDQSRESISPSIYFTGRNSSDNLNQLGSVSEGTPKATHKTPLFSTKPTLFSWPWDEIHEEDQSMEIFHPGRYSPSKSTTNSTPQDQSSTSSPSIKETPDDVFSFPPLPQRRQTSDWISPLPDISAPSNQGNQSLYHLGIDATTGTSQSSTSATTEGDSCETGNSRSPASETGIPSSKRAKSIILPHPQALPRICETTKLGSSIGSSSGARRKSSHRVPHVDINEPILEPAKRKTAWKKPRRDSGYPSDIHYASDEDSAKESEKITSSRASSSISSETLQQRTRRKLLEEKAPQLATTDCAGIYLTLTGADQETKPCDIDCDIHEGTESRKGSQSPSVDWIG